MSSNKRQNRPFSQDDTSEDDISKVRADCKLSSDSLKNEIENTWGKNHNKYASDKDIKEIYNNIVEWYSFNYVAKKDDLRLSALINILKELNNKFNKLKRIEKKIQQPSQQSSQQVQPSPKPLKIIEATSEQKKALKSTGEVSEEDIDKYGIVGDYKGYYEDWYKKENGKYNDEKLDFVASFEADYHRYYNNTYTSSQLSKSYKKIAESFIIQNSKNECDANVIIEYLKFIQENPQFALPTLLWIDTFHDFKEERLKKGKGNLNQVIDHLCHKIYGHHWGGLDKDNTIKDCVIIGHHYNFDKMYQNSFFNFNTGADKKPEVTGFHKDVIHTVLRPLVEATNFKGEYTKGTVANLLYNVSNAFINVKAENLNWEGDFLYAYLMYNFNFDMTKDGLIQDLRDVFWEQIKADKKEDYTIPFYAKDVDKGSSNFFKGTNVILPASLFDSNRSNSSDIIGHFVPIDKTVIPLCNGYNFEYHYSGTYCNLTLKYSSKVDNKIQSFDLCTTDNFSNNSSCVNTSMKEEDLKVNYPNIDDFIKKLSTHKKTQKDHLKKIYSSISTLLYSIPPNYDDSVDDNILTSVKDSISKVYFQGKSGCVKIPNGQGMSPVDVVSVVIGLLLRGFNPSSTTSSNKKRKDVSATPTTFKNQNSGHTLSPISCKELDFWVALKRIGDFGQIMQCKQIGIPLFTNDNMQLLISMAACSSAVWTGDNAKVLWYDSTQDAILCNGLNPDIQRNKCNKYRCNTDTYSEDINKLLLFKGEDTRNVIENKETKLEKTAKEVEKIDKLPEIESIRRNGCVMSEERSKKINILHHKPHQKVLKKDDVEVDMED